MLPSSAQGTAQRGQCERRSPGQRQLGAAGRVVQAPERGKARWGVIGPSRIRQVLARALLVGVWQPGRGKVRLDGCTFDQWSSEVLAGTSATCRRTLNSLGGTVAQKTSPASSRRGPASDRRRRPGGRGA